MPGIALQEELGDAVEIDKRGDGGKLVVAEVEEPERRGGGEGVGRDGGQGAAGQGQPGQRGKGHEGGHLEHGNLRGKGGQDSRGCRGGFWTD